MTELCTECKQAEAEWDFGKDKYCQMCWEAHCDETWWEICAPYWREPEVA